MIFLLLPSCSDCAESTVPMEPICANLVSSPFFSRVAAKASLSLPHVTNGSANALEKREREAIFSPARAEIVMELQRERETKKQLLLQVLCLGGERESRTPRDTELMGKMMIMIPDVAFKGGTKPYQSFGTCSDRMIRN